MHPYELRVRYGETDPMGFAYYAHYLNWFEIGRTELLRALDVAYRDVEAAGIRLPVLEAWCRYRASARYDDRLTIETGVLRLSRAGVRFGYRVRRAGEEPELTVGYTDHCYLDRRGRPVRPPADLAELLARAPRAPGDLLGSRDRGPG